MTAEPSAADVKYSPSQPYMMSMPLTRGGSAPDKKSGKAKTQSRATEEQENHRQQQYQRQQQQQGDNDDEDEDESDSKSKGKTKKAKNTGGGDDDDDDANSKAADDDDKKNVTKKSRRELPPHTVAILKGWMLSPEHVKHPYPTDEVSERDAVDAICIGRPLFFLVFSLMRTLYGARINKCC